MQHSQNGTLVLSATDLTNHLACEHLTAERRKLALGLRPVPRPHVDAHAELIRERGQRHEDEQLAVLVAEAGGDWVDLRPRHDGPPTVHELERLSAATQAAMQAGSRLLYQATLFDGRWQGRPDFLRRVEVPSGLGSYAYEIVDTKLARQVKPHVVHQLCLYDRLVAAVQGVEPDDAVVVLGTGAEERVRLTKYRALHRHVVGRLERALEGTPAETYPEPTAHCAICQLWAECDTRRRHDDHLSLVANARRDQRKKLVKAGIRRLDALADQPDDRAVEDLAPERFSLLRHQARLQLNARTGETPVLRHLVPEAARGYARLPDPSPGDVFFDLEGDPYLTTDGGIEYL
jgi:uncharacterized protein